MSDLPPSVVPDGFAPEPPFERSNPAPRGLPAWLWIAIGVLLVAVVALQRPEGPDPVHAAEMERAKELEPVGTSPLILIGKIVVAFSDPNPEFAPFLRQQLSGKSAFVPPSSADKLRTAMVLIGVGATSPEPGPLMMGQEEPAPSVAEVMEELNAKVAEDSPLRQDMKSVEVLLAAAEGDRMAGSIAKMPALRAALDALPVEEAAGLKQRHGWYAEVLFSAGQPESPVRQTAKVHAGLFVAVMMVAGLGLFVAFVAGIVLLIVAIVRRAGGGLPFREAVIRGGQDPIEPRSEGSRRLWLETFAVFLLGFLLLRLGNLALDTVATKENSRLIIVASLLGQWLLLPLIFWPVFRGMPLADWRRQIGWHAPSRHRIPGEIGSGLCAYLAGVPIYLGMAVVVVVLMMIWQLMEKQMGRQPTPPPAPRITEILGAGGPLIAILVFLLATVWAPIVEESIFRGALFRCLRGGWGFVLTAVVTAGLFAAMHGYMLLQLLMIFTLGFVFAVMREWRGSLIPSVTAHALHNGMVMTLMTVAGYFMTP